MTTGRGGPTPVVLLGLALGVDLWALQTYGLGVDPDPVRLHLVLFAAHLPAVVVGLHRDPRSPAGLARAVVPSLVAVVACALVQTGAADPAPSTRVLVDAVAATTWGWLCVGGAGAVLLGRARRHVPRRVRVPSALERLLELGAALLATALGLTMPATSRGLVERDRLGMLDQVHAVLTGYGNPAAVHLVAAYAVLLVVLLVVLLAVTHRMGRRAAG